MRLRRCAAATVLATGVLVLSAGPAAAFDLNCEDFASQAEAQQVYDANPDDPNDLDADDDGQACEEFTYGADPSATPTPAPTAGVSTTPAGGVATGDGSTAGTDPGTLPFLVGGLGLVAAGGAAFAARRNARGSA